MVLLDKDFFCGDSAQKEYLFGKNIRPATVFMETKLTCNKFFACCGNMDHKFRSLVSELQCVWVSAAETRLNIFNLATLGDGPPTTKHCESHIAASEFYFAHFGRIRHP